MNSVKVGNRTVKPTKIVCIGRNYYEHIEELNNEVPDEMVLFSKPNSSISEQLQSYQGEQLHYEGELCFVIENNQFAALGFGFDLTKRALQSELKSKGLPWERAKAFDGSAVFSSFIEIDYLPKELSFELKKNDEVIQMGSMKLMIHKPADILAEVQSFMTLNDDDIIMTGTPKGGGPVNKGDTFSVVVQSGNQELIEESWIAG